MSGTLKEKAKRLFYRFCATGEAKVLSAIEGCSTVSFDVFDTAIKRDVLFPCDVFTLMETELGPEERISNGAFFQQRIRAEKEASEKNSGGEVTLAEIYAQMPFREEQRKRLMLLECETELNVSSPNPAIKRVYDRCIQEGKNVIFISDMYLPSETIARILTKNGYDPSRLYVSCEAGTNKKKGRLFSHVQKAEKLSVADWVHIGDSISGDYLMPKRLGIKSVLIEPSPRYNDYVSKKIYHKSSSYRQLNHFIDTHIGRYADPYERIGYAVLGPLLYGFSIWLAREVPQEESIVFLAREGELLQRAFTMLSNRPSAYLHISRYAANSAFLDVVADVEKVLQNRVRLSPSHITLKDWADRFEIAEMERQKAFCANCLNENAFLDAPHMKERAMNAIWPVIKKNVAGQHSMLQSYLEQLNITENCAVVDVGWQSTIQALLNECKFTINKKLCHWTGYYMGCIVNGNSPAAAYGDLKRYGFLFDEKRHTWLRNGIRYSSGFFELLFLSTEGTTKSYGKTQEGTVYPILGEPENGEEAKRIITSLQNAGLQFVRDMHQSVANRLFTFDAEVSAGNYQAIARVPSLSTLSLFSGISYYDERDLSFCSEHNLAYYALHPRQLVQDFARTPAKSWFLKSLFKIPLPYISMINIANKLFNKNL